MNWIKSTRQWNLLCKMLDFSRQKQISLQPTRRESRRIYTLLLLWGKQFNLNFFWLKIDVGFVHKMTISSYTKSKFEIFCSPIGEVFRARLRQFPALVNCCTIDWFSDWPEEALQSVANRFLADIPDLDASDKVMEGLVCYWIVWNTYKYLLIKVEMYWVIWYGQLGQ